MTDSGAKGNPFVDCILAIDDAGFPPGQKILASDLMSALLQTVKQGAETEGELIKPEVFITELKKNVENPKPDSTHDIILSTQQSINELETQERQGNKNLSKGILALNFALAMLGTKLKQEAQQN